VGGLLAECRPWRWAETRGESIRVVPLLPFELDLEHPEAGVAGRDEDTVGPGADDLPRPPPCRVRGFDGDAVHLEHPPAEEGERRRIGSERPYPSLELGRGPLPVESAVCALDAGSEGHLGRLLRNGVERAA